MAATKTKTVAAKPATAKATKFKPSSTKAPAIKSLSRINSTKPRLISSKLSFKGKVFKVYTDTIQEPDGAKTDRDVIRHNGSVVILAVDDSLETGNPKDPIIILERQYRHAVNQFLFELPAGSLEPNETPLAGAKREMIEETGFRARRWTLLTKYFASPGFLGEWMQIYLARDLRAGIAKPEPDEHIAIHRVPLSEAMAMIADNKIHDGKTLIGLLLYDAGRRAGTL
jgi:ADP-ribose pyrophosphatase